MVEKNTPGLPEIPYDDIGRDPELFELYESRLQVAAQTGDVAAFWMLAQAYKPDLLEAQIRLQAEIYLPLDPEDVVHDTLLRVFDLTRAVDENEPPLLDLSYFLSVASNRTHNIRRRKYQFLPFDHLESGGEIPTEEEVALQAPANRDATIYNDGGRIMEYVMAVEVLKALKQFLTAAQHELVTLRYIQNFSVGEIASMLDVPYPDMRGRFKRLAQRLKRLEGDGLIERPESTRDRFVPTRRDY